MRELKECTGGVLALWGRGLGFGGSLWFRWFEASHFEIRDQLVGNLSEDRLSQSRLGSLERDRERCKYPRGINSQFLMSGAHMNTETGFSCCNHSSCSYWL